MSLENEIRGLSVQSMILTMALRRGMISKSGFAALSAEARKYFDDNPGCVAAAWLAFETNERAREAVRQKTLGEESARLIEVTIDERFAQTNLGYVIMLLRDKESGSAMPIFIGPLEVNAILMELQNIEPPRPLTPDLLKNILIDQFNTAVTKVVVTELTEDVFYALLYMEKNGQKMTQDCRPSDAIALALRFGAPIFVEEKLWTEMLTSENTKRLLNLFDKFSEQQGG